MSQPHQYPPPNTLSLDGLDAVLFDLDGVLTRTATLHAAAWKQLFDTFLEQRSAESGVPFAAFDLSADYQRYVDGKPRYDGVASFLAARGIALPMGQPKDQPGYATICSLGNAKQAYFMQQVAAQGIEVDAAAVDLVHDLKRHGKRVALVTSSKNATAILDAAGLTGLFDARVDGVEQERLALPGKPDPAPFLEALRRLAVEPGRAAIVEDASAGVQAGRDGGFAVVIGIAAREGHRQRLLDNGATLAAADLSELRLISQSTHGQGPTLWTAMSRLPAAQQRLHDVIPSHSDKSPVVFLDYDGVLSPIVPHPEDAVLSHQIRRTLTELAAVLPVAIITGRDLQDIRQRVDLDVLFYGGSHGFEIAGPHGFHAVHQPAEQFLAVLDQAEDALRRRLADIAGCQVERKRFAVAIHYRRVDDNDVGQVDEHVSAVSQAHPSLRRTGGKKVYELRPGLDWHKGTALFWLLRAMDLSTSQATPFYIGDDLTDEDAFAAIQDTGVGLVVADGSSRRTAAHYMLRDTDDVDAFLRALCRQTAARRR